jgi:hypothetical protein
MLTKFDEKRIEAEILGELYKSIEEKEAGTKRDYRKIGVYDEQDKAWDTGELLWEDEEKTIPKMKAKWGYVDKEELTEEDELYLQVYRKIKSALEKML